MSSGCIDTIREVREGMSDQHENEPLVDVWIIICITALIEVAVEHTEAVLDNGFDWSPVHIGVAVLGGLLAVGRAVFASAEQLLPNRAIDNKRERGENNG